MGKLFSTNRVLNEISHMKKDYNILELLITVGRLCIMEPSNYSEILVRQTATKIGESKLSDADISVLSLANELGGTLVTDDFSLCNLAKILSISIINLSSNGINEARKWTNFCYTCGKSYDIDMKICVICGNHLSKRYRKYKI